MRARDRMRQTAERRRQQEAVAAALGERRDGYGAPLFIRDEMANGWHVMGRGSIVGVQHLQRGRLRGGSAIQHGTTHQGRRDQ